MYEAGPFHMYEAGSKVLFLCMKLVLKSFFLVFICMELVLKSFSYV